MERIENAPIVSDDDDEVQYISTQPILGRSMGHMLPSDDDNDIILTSEALSDSLEDIDDVLAKHSQKALLQAAPTSSLYSLSQNVRASQILPTSSATTRRSRGVAKKSKAQLELESQQRVEKSVKQAATQTNEISSTWKIVNSKKRKMHNAGLSADSSPSSPRGEQVSTWANIGIINPENMIKALKKRALGRPRAESVVTTGTQVTPVTVVETMEIL